MNQLVILKSVATPKIVIHNPDGDFLIHAEFESNKVVHVPTEKADQTLILQNTTFIEEIFTCARNVLSFDLSPRIEFLTAAKTA
ncbi:hypothetical protein ACFQ4L_01055 [Lapidilactobacillus mulanensis]|uniref:Uncharacterized protein n=1 Tax=Lapidilactobacillus mulanensis TaxID=2485999 RepID=A0ABW4DP40_9LACO|nr:hypothetical protein [Lapidilactobacillus mulanensis]